MENKVNYLQAIHFINLFYTRKGKWILWLFPMYFGDWISFTLSQNTNHALILDHLWIVNLYMHKISPGDPSTTFLVTYSTRKIPECSDSMNSSVFMPENIRYHHFICSGLNSQEVLDFVLIQFWSWRPNNCSKIHNFLGIRSNSGKIMITYVF